MIRCCLRLLNEILNLKFKTIIFDLSVETKAAPHQSVQKFFQVCQDT